MNEERDHFAQIVTMKTMRDHFAMAALTGIFSNSTYVEALAYLHKNNVPETIARNAYEIADAMLEAREVTR